MDVEIIQYVLFYGMECDFIKIGLFGKIVVEMYYLKNVIVIIGLSK